MKDIIQSLWIGEALSSIEILCINSFLKNGHPFHLYTYSTIKGVPEGTTILDANTIIPKSKIFRYANGSVSAFSNYFRYKLLHDKGNWWVDTDVICLKPFDFKEEYVFGIQADPININTAVMKFPKGDKHMKVLMDQAAYPNRLRRKDTIKMLSRKIFNYIYHRNKIAAFKWGETGPKLFSKHIQTYNLHSFLQNKNVFYPVHWQEWNVFFEENRNIENVIKNETVAVHLWNEMYRNHIDKNEKFKTGSILKHLEHKYVYGEE